MALTTDELLAQAVQQQADNTARIGRKRAALMNENVSGLTPEQVDTIFAYVFNSIATVSDNQAKFEIVVCAFAVPFLVLTIRKEGFTHSAWCYLCIVEAIVAGVYGFYRGSNLAKKNMKKDD